MGKFNMGCCNAAPGSNSIGKAEMRIQRQKQDYLAKELDLVNYQQRIEAIVSYWFGYEDDPSLMVDYDRDSKIPRAWLKKRLNPDEATQQRIKRAFAEDLVNFSAGRYDEWAHNRDGRLALAILIGQMARLLSDDSKAIYLYGAKACPAANKALSNASLKRQYKA